MSTAAYTSDLFKEIKVETNDPKSDLIILTMKAKVTETLKVNPRIMNFGRMQQAQTATRMITVENTSKSPIKITKLEAEPANVFAVQPSGPFVLEKNQSRRLKVKVSTGSSSGFVGGHVNLETDLEHLPKKTVYVRVEVIGKQ